MNLLITGAWSGGKNATVKLEEFGHDVRFLQYETEALPCSYEWVEGVICNGLFLHHPIERFLNLKYIQLTSAGFDRVPIEYIAERGIEIRNARGVYSIPMAEFAVCGVLQLYKQSTFFRKCQTMQLWEKRRDLVELFGKTVCIVGCGSVGTECAKRFSAFGCRVIGVDLYPSNSKLYEKIFPISEMTTALFDSDIVILTLPYTQQTHHLFDSKIFCAVKPGTILVNIARGAVIDTAAMLSALECGQLSGAVLDVFEEEPLSPASPLWSMDNVLLTPHNSFVSNGNAARLDKIIFENLKVFEL